MLVLMKTCPKHFKCEVGLFLTSFDTVLGGYYFLMHNDVMIIDGVNKLMLFDW